MRKISLFIAIIMILSINFEVSAKTSNQEVVNENMMLDVESAEFMLQGKNGYEYEYNSEGKRIKKFGPSDVIEYSYNEDGRLHKMKSENVLIEFKYDFSNTPTGFSYEGNEFIYVKDDDFNVIGITDLKNKEVVRYSYDKNGLPIEVLGLDNKGNWVNKIKDTSFVGNINPIRLHSNYYDEESGLYYTGERYYNSVLNSFVGGTKNLAEIDTFMEFYKNSGMANTKVSYTVVTQVMSWRDALDANSNFGKSISYSSNWYSTLSDVELLTRLIYAENTLLSADQNGIGWVIVNRREKNVSYLGGNDYRDIATYPYQFEPITGGSSSSTANARTPDTSSSRWDSAMWIACSLLTTNSTSDYEDLFSKPTGIDDQLYFNGLSYFLLSSVTRDKSGGGIEYKMNGSWKELEDITVIFSTTSSLTNPSTKSTITSNSQLNTSSERNRHNIFYNFK